jgi:hypothetical protein
MEDYSRRPLIKGEIRWYLNERRGIYQSRAAWKPLAKGEEC